ncbi:MAG: SUMF1/EgtB/PvdO family nonheme iron enzyme [Polyangiales bacterium]
MSRAWEEVRALDATSADVPELLALAARWEADGERERAATALDRAWAADPSNAKVRAERSRVLDLLARDDHGLHWRYVPEGTFWMGTVEGDADEGPPHRVDLGAYWVTDTPLTWVQFCALAGWSAPPHAMPPDAATRPRMERFATHNDHKIRRRYCLSDGVDFAASLSADPAQAAALYAQKPMVAVSYWDVAALESPAGASRTMRLPTEAEWEKAARGGLRGARYPWGDVEPSARLADYDRFEAFALRDPRSLPPNGYGLYGMAGGVWEWTLDDYDAAFYAQAPEREPRCVVTATEAAKVLRGGSWSDCAAVLRVTFRMSHGVFWRGERRGSGSPNVGARLVLREGGA